MRISLTFMGNIVPALYSPKKVEPDFLATPPLEAMKIGSTVFS
jgi:hypothetical protein